MFKKFAIVVAVCSVSLAGLTTIGCGGPGEPTTAPYVGTKFDQGRGNNKKQEIPPGFPEDVTADDLKNLPAGVAPN